MCYSLACMEPSYTLTLHVEYLWNMSYPNQNANLNAKEEGKEASCKPEQKVFLVHSPQEYCLVVVHLQHSVLSFVNNKTYMT